MFKRGYENGEKVIEIYDGKVDLVLYNEKTPSFYFYRFTSKDVFGKKLSKELSLTQRKEVEKFLNQRGLDYDSLVEELLQVAWRDNMTKRDEM